MAKLASGAATLRSHARASWKPAPTAWPCTAAIAGFSIWTRVRKGRWAIETFDPDKSERPWSRGASGGHQVLVCPVCQVEREGWMDRLDRCERCGSTRLSVTLGEVRCRKCGTIASGA